MYLAVLAVFDFLVVNASTWANIQDTIEGGRFAGNIRYMAKQKLSQFILHTSNSMAGWLSVLISFDRLFMLFFPIRSKLYATPKHALLLMLVTCSPFVIYHMHNLYGFDGVEYYTLGNTSIDNNIRFVTKFVNADYKEFFAEIHSTYVGPILDGLSFVLTFINNVMIIYKIRHQILTRTKDLGVKDDKSDYASIKITKMLLIVSVLGCLLRAPMVIVNPVAFNKYYNREYNLWWSSFYRLLFVIAYALSYLNSCVNFFIYITLSSNFKKASTELLCQCMPSSMKEDKQKYKGKAANVYVVPNKE